MKEIVGLIIPLIKPLAHYQVQNLTHVMFLVVLYLEFVFTIVQ